MTDKSEPKRQTLQLIRLERLTDVVYALVLFRLFLLIPKPGESDWQWDTVTAFLSANLLTLALVFIGVAVTIIYWIQSNILFGYLEKSDGRHTTLSIVQLFLLLVFLYSLRLGVVLGDSDATRAFESCAAALVGITGAWAWWYATRTRRLVLPEVSDEDVKEQSDRILAEPITALITIPVAFLHPALWEVSWLSYLLIVPLLKRRGRRQRRQGQA